MIKTLRRALVGFVWVVILNACGKQEASNLQTQERVKICKHDGTGFSLSVPASTEFTVTIDTIISPWIRSAVFKCLGNPTDVDCGNAGGNINFCWVARGDAAQ